VIAGIRSRHVVARCAVSVFTHYGRNFTHYGRNREFALSQFCCQVFGVEGHETALNLAASDVLSTTTVGNQTLVCERSLSEVAAMNASRL